ncbi:lipid A deacylase LpxR family protein [Rhodopila sp.]|uniref:lipid A deacylase LpxR family protein n=1 Tax=Rhodopila sp. TaxID=2480087 RepID=UPI003D10779A
MTTLVIAAAILLPAVSVRAQPAPDTASIWTLQDENASISASKPTDRFYVNGLRLGWTSPTTVVPDFLQNLGHTLWGNGQQRISFDLSQQIYTPVNTQATIPNPRDRPYAGLLLGDFSLLSDTDDSRSVLALSFGILGPAAGGKGIQNGFHNLISQNVVNGWNHQIQNTAAVELLHERTWRLPIATVAAMETDALPSLTVAVGDVRDYLQTGITFRIGQGLNSDFGVPRPRPGLSGGDAYKPTRPFVWYAFVGADGQAVGYDILLQSSPFRGGPHVGKTWDVGELQGGFAVMAFGMRLTVAYVAQTQEFQGQTGGLHQFGSASIAFRF